MSKEYRCKALQLLFVSMLLLVTTAQLRVDTTSNTAPNQEMTCALKLVNSHLMDSLQITIVGNEHWLSGFAKDIRMPVTFLESIDKGISTHNLLYDTVFIVTEGNGNNTFVKNTLNHLWRNNGHYKRIVVWWRAGDVQEVMNVAMNLEMVRIAVVSGNRSDQKIYKYQEDCVNGIRMALATLVGSCSSTDFPQMKEDLFPDVFHWNKRGCKLLLTVEEISPHLELVPSREQGYTLQGILAPMATALAERINATIDVRTASDGIHFGHIFSNGTGFGVHGDLMKKRCDAGIGNFFRVLDSTSFVDTSPGYITLSFEFTVPSGLGPAISKWNLLRHEFTLGVWALLSLTYLVVSVTMSYSILPFRECPIQEVNLFMASALLGSSYDIPIPTLGTRLLVALWLMICLVMGTAYQAVWHGLMTVPWNPLQINSLQGLLNSDLTIVGLPTALESLKSLAEEEGNATLLALAVRCRLTRDLHGSVTRMASKKDFAILASSYTVLYNAAPLERVMRRRLIYTIPDFSTFSSQASVFLLRRGSPLAPTANYLVIRAFECGLTQYWAEKFKLHRLENSPTWLQLGLAKLGTVFQLLLIGQAASSLVFLNELLVHKFRVYLW